jgi:phosphate transport system substrate-binding protein
MRPACSAASTLGAIVLGILIPAIADAAESARAAGATFPQLLYERWAKAYSAQTEDTVTYTGTGSGDGLKQVVAGTVDFGGSDMPATGADARALIQVPSIVGGIVVVVNLPGLDPGGITLDGPTLAGLYSGAITSWNDAAIQRLNPTAPLPAIAVRPVHRADASGTTFVVTDYLSKISDDWMRGSGRGTSVRWPKGVEVKGSDGMVQAVAAEPGSIGYVEYSYARKGVMTYVNLMSADGRSVQPTPMSFAAAVAGLDWPTPRISACILVSSGSPITATMTAAVNTT